MSDIQIFEIVKDNPIVKEFLDTNRDYEFLVNGPFQKTELERIIEEYPGFFNFSKDEIKNKEINVYSILFISRKIQLKGYSKLKIYLDLTIFDNPNILKIIKS